MMSDAQRLPKRRGFLFQSHQVVDDEIHLRFAQAEGRHQAARLDLLRVGHPAAAGSRACSGPSRRPASGGSSGASGPGRRCPAAVVPRTRWQLTHDCDRNDVSARARGRHRPRPASSGRPASVSKSAGESTIDAQEHVGVLRAAILGALAEEQARLARSGTTCDWCGPGSGRSCRPAGAPRSCGRRPPTSGSGRRAAARRPRWPGRAARWPW